MRLPKTCKVVIRGVKDTPIEIEDTVFHLRYEHCGGENAVFVNSKRVAGWRSEGFRQIVNSTRTNSDRCFEVK